MEEVRDHQKWNEKWDMISKSNPRIQVYLLEMWRKGVCCGQGFGTIQNEGIDSCGYTVWLSSSFAENRCISDKFFVQAACRLFVLLINYHQLSGNVSKFVENPSEIHANATKRILKYLERTVGRSILYRATLFVDNQAAVHLKIPKFHKWAYWYSISLCLYVCLCTEKEIGCADGE